MKAKKVEELVYKAVTDGELEIDSMGRVWRVKTRMGKTRTFDCPRRRAEHDTGTYFQVRIMWNGKRANCLAHRLVWRHLHGPITEDKIVNHKSGNKKDNRPENLELATYSENAVHALRILKVGRTNQNGKRNAMAKLNEQAVREILSFRAEIEMEIKTRHGTRISELAKKYGVKYQTIWDIIRGRRWLSIK
jgi:hypothetical protein